jgi:hypothetical protein
MLNSMDGSSEINSICTFLECTENRTLKHIDYPTNGYSEYCQFHKEDGIFGTGESYEQYQIIENDFINFIKTVPLCEEHFNVHSPILRDIIIRTCVQIEVFFKEWAKEFCNQDANCTLWIKYNEIEKRRWHENLGNKKGVSNWSFADYRIFENIINSPYNAKIFVRVLNQIVNPFSNWAVSNNISWWDIYNNVKHSGHIAKKEANLITALEALAGLFQLHCVHKASLKYLKQFSSISINEGSTDFTIQKNDITTPIDSKIYLFKAINTNGNKNQIVTVEAAKLKERYSTRSRI